jgi:hypothetical protein
LLIAHGEDPGEKICQECFMSVSLDDFPIVWGTQDSETGFYIGDVCNDCHEWLVQTEIRNMNRELRKKNLEREIDGEPKR